MTHNTVDYAALIRRKGYRLTLQRRVVLDAVCACRGHATFQDVLERVRAEYAGIDPSTVYRTLDFLAELNLIASSHIGDQHVYEIAIGQLPHHHLVCRVCGAEVQIDDREVSAALEAIGRAYGFTVEPNHLILSGLCRDCRAQQGG
jgi:Fur family ferric uptake transcriptional regulator